MFSFIQSSLNKKSQKIVKISNINSCCKRKRDDALDDIIKTLSKRSKDMYSYEQDKFYKLLNKISTREQICDCNHQTKINEHQRLWHILTS